MGTWWKSFKHAWRGLKIVLRSEHNFRFHLLAATVAVALGYWRGLSRSLWIALLLVIAMIFALEIFNSAIERLVDILAPKTHGYAKEIKDLLAGMVLLVSFFAVIIAFIIFI